jgi:glycosyltransferase involved in cell wall biosynthesis
VIRVLHVVPRLAVRIGGAEMMVSHVMRYSDRERFEVAAISLYDPLDSQPEETLASSGFPLWYLGKKKGFDRRMYARVDRVLRTFRPHVVHSHLGVLRYALPSMLFRRIPAMLHTVHNLAEQEVDWLGRWVQRAAFKRGVVPVAIAQEVADSIRSLYGINGFPLIPYGIPTETYRQPRADSEAWRKKEDFAPEAVLFVCVARLAPQKNHVLLLQAFAQGPASNPRARLVLVGGGKLGPELEKEADALGLGDRVRFLGTRSDIPEILGAADVFVLSSDYEGSPLSIMEAMAAGKPVISTAVGGVPELVEDGRSGLLVPRGSPKALAEAMSLLVENHEAREAMGKASLELATERFDARVMTRAYEELYDKMVRSVHGDRRRPNEANVRP